MRNQTRILANAATLGPTPNRRRRAPKTAVSGTEEEGPRHLCGYRVIQDVALGRAARPWEDRNLAGASLLFRTLIAQIEKQANQPDEDHDHQDHEGPRLHEVHTVPSFLRTDLHGAGPRAIPRRVGASIFAKAKRKG